MANEPAKKPKRLVKNPETFRERALKATEASEKPGTASKLKGISGGVFRPVTAPVGKASRQVTGSKPFRLLSKPFRWIGKILFPKYFRNSWRELRLVKWPSLRESRRLTLAVIIFAVVISGTIAIVDYGLDKLFRDILLK
jgi:preprotein translocase SecE subunit